MLPPPNIIKCDVEGAEFEVFDAQQKMLAEIRRVVICEVCDESSASMTRLFSEFGYRMYDGEQSPVAAKEIQQASWNTIAVPKERDLNFLRR